MADALDSTETLADVRQNRTPEKAAPKKRGRPKGSKDLKPRPSRRRPQVTPPAASSESVAQGSGEVTAKEALLVIGRHLGLNLALLEAGVPPDSYTQRPPETCHNCHCWTFRVFCGNRD